MNSPFKYPTSCAEGTWESRRWGTRDSDVWPDGFPKPRTCSFCGSVHPDDVLTLAKMGWELEMSTKSYKSYWHPPGHAAHHARVMADFGSHIKGTILPALHSEPTPPVKLYGNHLTTEKLAELNAQLLINKARTP